MELLRQASKPGFPFPRQRSFRSGPTEKPTPTTAAEVMAEVKSVIRMMKALATSPANIATEPGYVTIRDQPVLRELSAGLVSHIEYGTLEPTADPTTPRLKVRTGGLVYRFAPATRKGDPADKYYRIDGLGHKLEAVEHENGTVTFTVE